MAYSSFRRLYLAAATTALTLFVVPARAAPGESEATAPSAPIQADEANRLFREAREDHNQGRFKDALRKYRAAWRLRASPDVAANMSQVEIELKLLDQAAMHLAFALSELLPSTSREQRVALESSLADVRTKVAELKLDLSPDTATVTVDGKPLEPVLIKTGIFITPGTHTISATAEGYQAQELAMTANPRERVSIAFELEPVQSTPSAAAGDAAGPSTHPDHRKGRRASGRTATIIAGGVLAGAGVGVGAGFLARKLIKKSDAEELHDEAVDQLGENGCSDSTETVCKDLESANDAASASRKIAIGGFAAGGAFAVATVIAAVTWPRSEKLRSEKQGSRRLWLDVAGTPGGAYAGIRGAF